MENFARLPDLYPEVYAIIRRVNDCYVKAGNPVHSKSMMTGAMFLRSQFAYKTAVGMALANIPHGTRIAVAVAAH
jgi:hypothetical protein